MEVGYIGFGKSIWYWFWGDKICSGRWQKPTIINIVFWGWDVFFVRV